MKTVTQKEIKNLIYFQETSAYANVNEIEELAAKKIDETHDEKECKDSIFYDIDAELQGYIYVECEDQGSYKRHIWHKI